MSFYIVDDVCISCGACEYICPTLAIERRADNFRGTFIIDPMLCFDCDACPSVCPVDCIHQDPGVDHLPRARLPPEREVEPARLGVHRARRAALRRVRQRAVAPPRGRGLVLLPLRRG